MKKIIFLALLLSFNFLSFSQTPGNNEMKVLKITEQWVLSTYFEQSELAKSAMGYFIFMNNKRDGLQVRLICSSSEVIKLFNSKKNELAASITKGLVRDTVVLPFFLLAEKNPCVSFEPEEYRQLMKSTDSLCVEGTFILRPLIFGMNPPRHTKPNPAE